MVSITTATMATDIKTPSSTPSSLSFMSASLRAMPNHASELPASNKWFSDSQGVTATAA